MKKKQTHQNSGNGEHVVIYTDGGCDPNPGVGGWGAVLMFQNKMKQISGGEKRTTNNRMELIAAIEALSALKRPCHVIVHTDSEYLRQGITSWMPAWKKRGWKRKTGQLKNADLWKTLDNLSAQHKIQWRWVPGHAGHVYNEMCDVLATKEIKKRKSRS